MQSLSDSDQTEGTLSPALVPQFRRIPAPNSEKNQDFMEPAVYKEQEKKSCFKLCFKLRHKSDEDQKVRAKTEVSQL